MISDDVTLNILQRPSPMTRSRHSAILQSMQTSAQTGRRSIEVTGLPEGAIRALEALVAALRIQQNPGSAHASYEEWSSALREWVQSHPKRETSADWSRESIYTGRGQ